jgi:hypothetical protein
MGEFERSGMGQRKGVVWAIEDIFTASHFAIAAIAGLIGYILFEFLGRNSKPASHALTLVAQTKEEYSYTFSNPHNT